MSTEAAIAKLHALFAELTGRAEPLRFHERAWFEVIRSPEYNHDAAPVERDLRLIVSYLRVQIREAKRNLGALKLRNFLAVDQWFADLAEAQAWQKSCRTARAARPAETPMPVADQKPLVSDEEFQAAAARLAEIRDNLAGGMRHA
jgi:hypothetical protein